MATFNYDRSRVPIYIQVASVMRRRIETGHWGWGERIPTMEELSAEFRVARVTIRQAIEVLRIEGFLGAKAGRGTFVSGKRVRKHWLNLASDFQSIVDSIKSNVVKNISVAEAEELPTLRDGEGRLAEAYVKLQSVQYNDDQPFAVVNLSLEKSIFDRERKNFTRVVVLARVLEMEEIDIAHAYQTVAVGVADTDVAGHLELDLGEPTAYCRLVLVDSKDVAIYVADIHYNRDCFSLKEDLLAKGSTYLENRKT